MSWAAPVPAPVGDDLGDPLEAATAGRVEEVLAALEVVVDRRRRDARPPGDLAHGGAVEPVLRAGRGGGVEQALTRSPRHRR